MATFPITRAVSFPMTFGREGEISPPPPPPDIIDDYNFILRSKMWLIRRTGRNRGILRTTLRRRRGI